MAFVIADRVRETTTTTGTGAVTLAGAYISFQSFSAAIGNGNNTYYTIASPTTGEWEVGIGTYTSSTNSLSRDTVLSSSNSGNLVNFAAGTKDVFVTQPSERSLLINSASNGLFAGNAAFTANGVLYANSTTSVTSGSALQFDGADLGVGVTPSSWSTGKAVEVGFAGAGLWSNAQDSTYITSNAYFNSGWKYAGTGKAGTYIISAGAHSWNVNNTSGTAGGALSLSVAMTLDATGNLGIGTSSPARKLTIGGTANAYMNFNATSYRNYTIGSDSAGFIVYDETAAAYRLVIDSSGNVGIGTSSPAYRLGVNGGASPAFTHYTNNSTGTTSSDGFLVGNDGTGAYLVQRENDFLSIWTNNTERMRLDSSGNLGIGTSSPLAKLNVVTSGDKSTIAIGDTASSTYSQLLMYGGSGKYNWSIGAQYNVDNAFEITRSTATGGTTFSTPAFVINSSGNLGLGVTPSASNLAGFLEGGYGTFGQTTSLGTSIAGNAYYNSGWKYKLSSTATLQLQDSSGFKWHTAGSGTAGNTITFTQAMTLDASGKLGIGTTSPGAQLTVIGSAGKLYVDLSGDNYYDAANHVFRNFAGTERARITSGGYLGISTSSPKNYLDLGQPSNGNGLTWDNYSNVFSEYSSGALILSSNYYGNIGSGGYKTTLTATFGAAGIQVSGTSGSGTSGLIQFFVDPATSKTAGNAFTPTERMRISGAGDVGIGTSSPSAKLHVAGTVIIDNADATNELTFSGTQFTNVLSASTSGFQLGTTGAGYLAFLTSNTERARINSSGAWSFGSSGTATGNSGQVLTSNGSGSAPSWQDAGGGPVKAWVNFNGTGTVAIRASSNVSSITDNGTGTYTVNFTTAFADANYAPACMVSEDTGSGTRTMVGPYGTAPTTTAFRVGTFAGTTLTDMQYVQIVFVR